MNDPRPGALRIFVQGKSLLKGWSGQVDLDHRPPGPGEGGRERLSAASGVACGTLRPFTLFLNWTEVGPLLVGRFQLVSTEEGANAVTEPCVWLLGGTST